MPLYKSLPALPENTVPVPYVVTRRFSTYHDVEVLAVNEEEATKKAQELWVSNRDAYSEPRELESFEADLADVDNSL